MNKKSDSIKLYVANQYVPNDLNNIGSIKNANLKTTLNNVVSLKWLIYGLVLLSPLIFFLTIFLQLDKLIIGVYLNLFILIIILNILFMKYSIWGKVQILKSESLAEIELVVGDKHYFYPNGDFDKGKITSDELVMVFLLYIKWYLVLFEILLFLHSVTVFLAFYINGWLGGVLIILSLVWAYLMYLFLVDLSRVIADLLFFKKVFEF